MEIAQRLVTEITPYCEKVVITGDLRRKQEMVKRIEIAAVPKIHRDLFGEAVPAGTSEIDDWMTKRGIWAITQGKTHKQFVWGGMNIDLFLHPDPRTWGVGLMRHTGSVDFVQWMIKPNHQGGACPDGLSVREDRVWRLGRALHTPEEVDVFRLFGIEWVEPENRNMYKKSDYILGTGESLI